MEITISSKGIETRPFPQTRPIPQDRETSELDLARAELRVARWRALAPVLQTLIVVAGIVAVVAIGWYLLPTARSVYTGYELPAVQDVWPRDHA